MSRILRNILMAKEPKPGELPPSPKLRELLAISLYSLEKSPGLSTEDTGWLRAYALRLLTSEPRGAAVGSASRSGPRAKVR